MAPAVFTSCHVEIGGLRFHYTDWGGGGPPLVMLHGLSGHARTWDDTAAALSEPLPRARSGPARPRRHRLGAGIWLRLRWHRICWASSTLWICAK